MHVNLSVRNRKYLQVIDLQGIQKFNCDPKGTGFKPYFEGLTEIQNVEKIFSIEIALNIE
jgi:hypothetical protein